MKFMSLLKVNRAVFFLSLFALFIMVPPATAAPQTFNLEKYHGKVVYLDFWASWCGPCKLSFPFMENLRYDYLPKDFVVIAVNVDHSHKAAMNFLQKMNSNLAVIFDSKGDLARTYKVADMPTSILFDRQGKIRYVHKGFYTNERGKYIAHIKQLISEQ